MLKNNCEIIFLTYNLLKIEEDYIFHYSDAIHRFKLGYCKLKGVQYVGSISDGCGLSHHREQEALLHAQSCPVPLRDQEALHRPQSSPVPPDA